MRYLILTLITILAAIGADTEKLPLPTDLRDAAAIHKGKILEIDTKTAKLKSDVARETFERFDALVKKYTKAGDLEGALLAKKLCAELTEGCGGASESLVKKLSPAAAAVVGKWKRGGLIVTLDEDLTFTDSRGVKGTWSLNRNGSFVMVWLDSGTVVQCTKPAKSGNAIMSNTTYGGPLERIIE